jgi:serine/threonine protein kinase/Tol biopolymer transport system component
VNPERWQQVDRLYQSALAREPGQRGVFLTQACKGDDELRREIESLLAQESLRCSLIQQPIQSLTAGAQLGPYKIEAPIGAGGMGEVFRARDTRLDRTVAIKILPHDRIADPERKRRFFQEARAVSALNHPNIVTLHDIANESGLDYLVMEYVPGRSLDKLISPKGMPLADVLGYCTQIAGALAAAHAAGIVHRDIKPANLIVTSESQVKILDFGLAKLEEHAPSPEGETQTQESALTAAETVMGTLAYMSPEQASAKPLDHRTDIFSLGVVFYEMLAGTRPFRGKSQVETMHAIINDPARPLAQYPPELDEIMAKALAKESKDRYQHAGDLGLDLRRFQRAWETKSLPSMRVTLASAPRSRIGWAVAAAVLVVGLPAAWWEGHRAALAPIENPLANAKFTRFTDFPGSELEAAISRDGKFIAFLSDRDGPFDIWLSQVGTGRFVNLTQGRAGEVRMGYRSVGFSASGSEIWLAGGNPGSRIRLMPLMGGEPRNFLGESSVNAAWSPDGTRLAYHTRDPGDPMFVADRTGANARRILRNEPDVHNHYPVWSPDGQWIYLVRGRPATNEMDLWRIPSAGGEPERLTQHNNDVAYPTPIDPRTVLYVAREEDGSGPWLWALDLERKRTRPVSFGLEKYTSLAASADGRRLVATVANPRASLWSVPILDRVADERHVKPFPVPTVGASAPQYGAKSLFYLSSSGAGDGLWRYQDGQALEIWQGADGSLFVPPAVSHDGRRVAVVLRSHGKLRLHSLSADGAEFQPLTDAIDVRGAASWSPDGRWIVAGGDYSKEPGLFKIPVEGGAPVRLIAGVALNPVWSPDGNLIVYTGANVATSTPLFAVRPDGSRVDLPAIRVRREGERARFLPDGKGLVYMQGLLLSQDFWLLDLTTMKTRLLTHFNNTDAMRTFDITPDGKQIVFDRLRDNSDIVLIDLPKGRQ